MHVSRTLQALLTGSCPQTCQQAPPGESSLVTLPARASLSAWCGSTRTSRCGRWWHQAAAHVAAAQLEMALVLQVLLMQRAPPVSNLLRTLLAPQVGYLWEAKWVLRQLLLEVRYGVLPFRLRLVSLLRRQVLQLSLLSKQLRLPPLLCRSQLLPSKLRPSRLAPSSKLNSLRNQPPLAKFQQHKVRLLCLRRLKQPKIRAHQVWALNQRLGPVNLESGIREA